MTTPYEVLDLISKFSIATGIGTYCFQLFRERRNKKKESNERLRRVCKALLVEVNALDEWYKSPQYEALKKRHYSAAYSDNIVNTAPYDGIVNSGLITYLEDRTQEKLNDYFFFAAVHNKRMYFMAQIYNNKASSTEFNLETDLNEITESEAWKLNEVELTTYEKKMKDLIPQIRQSLDTEIREIKH